MEEEKQQPEVGARRQESAELSQRCRNPHRHESVNSLLHGSSRSKIVDFYDNRSVFITGASGFVGKVLIEKLLRTCPRLRRIFVLIRPKRNKQPQERLEELLKTPLFDQVRSIARQDGQSVEDRVVVVEGDVTQANLGLSEQNLLRIMNEVTVVYHSAATVKFDEPLKESVNINITGTKHIIDLCRKIPQLAAIVHVSTAYANCDRDEIDEHIYPVNMDPEKLIQMANWLDQDTLQELRGRLLDKRPNTYTYTKALAEWLLIKCARDLPVVVCRPSIVTATLHEPMPGWVDNLNGPTGILIAFGKGLIRSLHGRQECVSDLVPVDTVINLLIALGWFAHVYQNLKSPCLSEVSSASESLDSSPLQSAGEEEADEENNGNSTQYGFTPACPSSVNLFEEKGRLEAQESSKNCMESGQKSHQHIRRSGHLLLSHLASRFETNNNNDESNNNHVDLIAPGADEELAKKVTYLSLPGDARHELLACQAAAALDQNISELSPSVSPVDDGYRSANHSPVALSRSLSRSATGSDETIQDHDLNDKASSSTSESKADVMSGKHKAPSFVSAQRRLAEQQERSDLEYRLKQFRHTSQRLLSKKNLPEELADIPVFHCSSGAENPLTWHAVAYTSLSIYSIFPSITVYRVPRGSWTPSMFVHNFWRFILHYMPAYIYDFFALRLGSKISLVRVYKRLDTALKVMDTFTMNQWYFRPDNRCMLIDELMSPEDRRLFDCDVRTIDWNQYMKDYVLGARKFILNEPMSNLEQARKNLVRTYYRNLTFEVLLAFLLGYLLFSYFIPKVTTDVEGYSPYSLWTEDVVSAFAPNSQVEL